MDFKNLNMEKAIQILIDLLADQEGAEVVITVEKTA